MKFSTSNHSLAVTVIGLCLILVFGPAAQSAGSFSDLDIEYSELKVTLDKVLGENKQLHDTLAETRKTLADMRKNLAATNGETDIVQRQTMQMKLRMDALGIDSVSGNGEKLEQRLLTAVNDLRTSAAEKKNLSEVLVRLVETASLYAKTATGASPESRLALETEIRGANAILGMPSLNAVQAPAVASTMTDGMVISVKADLALVVINLGSKQGLKVGTPFQIVRGRKIIGTVRVVDVREKIAGAVIQDLSSEKDQVKVGDLLKVDAQRPISDNFLTTKADEH